MAGNGLPITMNDVFDQLQIQVNPKIYLKDPNSSALGKKIIIEGINLIDQIGLEEFTIRKLAKVIGTSESSIYRYFESKHKLLLYIVTWYWGWIEYHMVFETNNLASPEAKLKIAIAAVVNGIHPKMEYDDLNANTLHRIVICESSKAYLTKGVDIDNKVGLYSGYKRLINRISNMIVEINSEFKFAKTLTSTIVEGIHHQQFFADHLPSLTDITNDREKLTDFYYDMALSIINAKHAD